MSFDSKYTAFSTYPHIPYRDWWRRRWTAVIIGTIHLVWALVRLFTALGKLVEFDDFDYVRHYTNWSWTITTLFYLATIGIVFVQVGWLRHDSAYSFFLQFIVALGYFPVFGIVMVVRVIVWMLLGTDSPFLTKFFEVMSPGHVFLGDDAFHFMPVVEIILFALVYRKFILYSLNLLIAYSRMLSAPVRFAVFIFYSAYWFVVTTVVPYRLFFDPHDVYSTDIPDIDGLSVAFLTLTVFVLLPFLFVLALLNVATGKAYTPEWLHRNDADPYVVSHYEDDLTMTLAKYV